MRFASGAPKRHKKPTESTFVSQDEQPQQRTRNRHYLLRPKTSAFAAFIRYGFSAPPAPRAFIASHNPGATKPTPPIMKALKRVVRYHVRGILDGGLCAVILKKQLKKTKSTEGPWLRIHFSHLFIPSHCNIVGEYLILDSMACFNVYRDQGMGSETTDATLNLEDYFYRKINLDII